MGFDAGALAIWDAAGATDAAVAGAADTAGASALGGSLLTGGTGAAAGAVGSGVAGFGASDALALGAGSGVGASTLGGSDALALGAGLGADASTLGTGVGGGATSFGSGLTSDTALGLTGSSPITSGLPASDLAALDPSAATGGASFLPVTGSGGLDGIATLPGDLGSQLGVQSGDLAATGQVSSPLVPDTPLPSPGPAPDGSGFFGSAGNWIKNNKLEAGLLGTSLYNGLRQPKLPGAAQTALGASSAAVQDAQGIIQSGGTSSPLWASQKANIDQQVNTNLQNTIAQMTQAAQTNGMGGANSGVVQQQINKLTTDAETQRQALYNQTLQQIVTNAVTELSGGNQTLGSIAQMQMSQSEQARAAASQTAELALLLGKQGGG